MCIHHNQCPSYCSGCCAPPGRRWQGPLARRGLVSLPHNQATSCPVLAPHSSHHPRWAIGRVHFDRLHKVSQGSTQFPSSPRASRRVYMAIPHEHHLGCCAGSKAGARQRRLGCRSAGGIRNRNYSGRGRFRRRPRYNESSIWVFGCQADKDFKVSRKQRIQYSVKEGIQNLIGRRYRSAFTVSCAVELLFCPDLTATTAERPGGFANAT